MARISKSEAVSMAQAILQRMTDSSLIVDGRWGGYTNRTYERATPAVRIAVDSVLAQAGTNNSALLSETRGVESATTGATYDDIIESESRSAGVSPTIMKRILKIENPRRDPKAVSQNGSSHGLFQIQQKTWEGVLRNNGLSQPGWSERYDAAANTKIACLLTKENAESVKQMGYSQPIDGRILYLVHQQGPAGAVEIYQRANKLPVSRSVIKGARLEDNLPRSVTDRSPDGFARFWWDKAGSVML